MRLDFHQETVMQVRFFNIEWKIRPIKANAM